MLEKKNVSSADIARPTLQVVIVNWRSGGMLRVCLDSIYASRADNHVLKKITIVDNDSSDESIDDVVNAEIPTEIIRPGGNIGFGRGCNLGSIQSDSDMILFLNPDTRVGEESLDEAVWGFTNFDNGELAVLGVQLNNIHGQVGRTCSRLPTTASMLWRSLGLSRIIPAVFRAQYMLDWDHAETRCVEQVMGAFFMVRRGVFEALGCFDERYFVYFEEVDYCRKASDRGYDVVYLASTSITHQGGGASQRVRSTRLFYSLRSRLQYFNKHHSRLSYWVVVSSTALIEPWARCLHSLAKGRFTELPEIFSAFKRLYGCILMNTGWVDE